MSEETTTAPATQDNTEASPQSDDATTIEGKEAPKADTAKVTEGAAGKEGESKETDDSKPKGLSDDSSETDKEGDEQEKESKAPEEYEDFTVPEGINISKDAMEKFKELAKASGLSQEQAQKFLSMNSEEQINNAKAKEAADKEADQQQITEWLNESRKEHGDKFNEVRSTAQKVYYNDNISSKDLRILLESTGLDCNPHVINLFNNFAKMTGEDTFVKDDGGGKKEEKFEKLTDIFPQPKVE
jgi:hypothetical protein